MQQQTQFTKRHLFHYFDALWLITSWPVCEMTATYSPVNRKICTCSMWAAGSKRSAGELWGEDGEGRRGERHRRSTRKTNCVSPTSLVSVGKGQGQASHSGRKALTKHCHFDAGLQLLLTSHLCLCGGRGGGETVPAAEITPDLHSCALLADFYSLFTIAVYTFLTCWSYSFVRGYSPIHQFNFRLR